MSSSATPPRWWWRDILWRLKWKEERETLKSPFSILTEKHKGTNIDLAHSGYEKGQADTLSPPCLFHQVSFFSSRDDVSLLWILNLFQRHQKAHLFVSTFLPVSYVSRWNLLNHFFISLAFFIVHCTSSVERREDFLLHLLCVITFSVLKCYVLSVLLCSVLFYSVPFLPISTLPPVFYFNWAKGRGREELFLLLYKRLRRIPTNLSSHVHLTHSSLPFWIPCSPTKRSFSLSSVSSRGI